MRKVIAVQELLAIVMPGTRGVHESQICPCTVQSRTMSPTSTVCPGCVMIMSASVSRQTTEDVEEKTDNHNDHQDLHKYPSNILKSGDRLFELGDYNIRGRIDLDLWHSLI
jgi:hypothetical protein